MVDNRQNGQIEDPQDTAQNERIKAILRRREEVLEARDRAKDQYISKKYHSFVP